MNGKNFTARQKTGLLVLLALVLFSFKKKPVGGVEVGQGEFGEFDTDGDLDDIKSTTAKAVVPQSGKTSKAPISVGGYDDANLSNMQYKTGGNGCCN